MAQDDSLYSLEDIAKAAQEAMESEEVEGYASDPVKQYGRIGMTFLDNLASLKGGTLAPGCCTQGCCDDGVRFKV
jgi:hypothetical protein